MASMQVVFFTVLRLRNQVFNSRNENMFLSELFRRKTDRINRKTWFLSWKKLTVAEDIYYGYWSQVQFLSSDDNTIPPLKTT